MKYYTRRATLRFKQEIAGPKTGKRAEVENAEIVMIINDAGGGNDVLIDNYNPYIVPKDPAIDSAQARQSLVPPLDALITEGKLVYHYLPDLAVPSNQTDPNFGNPQSRFNTLLLGHVFDNVAQVFFPQGTPGTGGSPIETPTPTPCEGPLCGQPPIKTTKDVSFMPNYQLAYRFQIHEKEPSFPTHTDYAPGCSGCRDRITNATEDGGICSVDADCIIGGQLCISGICQEPLGEGANCRLTKGSHDCSKEGGLVCSSVSSTCVVPVLGLSCKKDTDCKLFESDTSYCGDDNTCHNPQENITSTIPPLFSVQPDNFVVKEGERVSFDYEIDTSSAGPLRYQWVRDGEPIPGADGANFVIEGVEKYDEGEYSLIVRNNYGTTESDQAQLKVEDAGGPGTGLHASYYRDHSFKDFYISLVESGGIMINRQWYNKHPNIPVLCNPPSTCAFSVPFGVRWNGKIIFPQSGEYRLYLLTWNGGGKVVLDGDTIIDNTQLPSIISFSEPIVVGQASEEHDIRIDFYGNTYNRSENLVSTVRFQWVLPDGTPQMISSSNFRPIPFREIENNVSVGDTVYVDAISGAIIDRVSSFID